MAAHLTGSHGYCMREASPQQEPMDHIITIQNIIYTYQEEKSYKIENITSINGNQVGMTTHESCYKWKVLGQEEK